MRPNKMRTDISDTKSRAVFRDGLSQESYQKLEDANGVSEIQEVLLEIFEPSNSDD